MKRERFNEDKLPIWARNKLSHLRTVIQELEAYRQMHSILSDKDRDWFQLPDPFNGCNEEEMNLWFLKTNRPFPVCTLYKGDMLFIGRANKSRYGFRLINLEGEQ